MSQKLRAANCGAIAPEIEPDRCRSLDAMHDAATRQFAERPAFRAFGRTLTYAVVDRPWATSAASLRRERRDVA